jgi:hypothetical protein
MAEVGAMEIKIGVVLDDVAKKLKEAQKPFKELGEVLQSAGRNLTQMFTIPIAGAAAAVLSFSKEAKAAFGEFSTSVRGSLGKVGDDLAKTVNLRGLLRAIADTVRSLGQAFIDLPDPLKLTIIAFATFISTAGPALIIMGKLVTVMGSFQMLIHGPAGMILLLGTLASVAIGLGSAFRGATHEAHGLSTAIEDIDEAGKVAVAREKLRIATQGYEGLKGAVTTTTLPIFGAVPSVDQGAANAARHDAALKVKAARDELAAAQENLMTPKAEAYGWEELDAPLNRYNESMKQASINAAIHGETVGIVTDRVNAAKTAIAELNQSGWTESDENVKQLNMDLEENEAKLGTLTTGWTTFIDALRNLPSVAQQISSALMDVFTQFSQGVGNAIAQVLVYGESFKKLMTALLKQVLATVISTFVQMAIQYVVNAILSHVYAASVGAANIGTSIARAGAAAFAASVETFGIYGIAAGPGFAASAITGASAAALSGKAIGTAIGAAAAEGGIFTTPGLTSIAERGKPEMVLNDANIKRFFPGMAAGGTRPVIHTHVFMNSREIMEAITDEFRLQGLGA